MTTLSNHYHYQISKNWKHTIEIVCRAWTESNVGLKANSKGDSGLENSPLKVIRWSEG